MYFTQLKFALAGIVKNLIRWPSYNFRMIDSIVTQLELDA